MPRRSLAVACWLVSTASAVILEGYNQKDVDCAACMAVGDELTRALLKEKASQNLDLQSHRVRAPAHAAALATPGARAMSAIFSLVGVPRRNLLLCSSRQDRRAGKAAKIIDYKMSELRVIEVMENVCPAMADYGHFNTQPFQSVLIKKDQTSRGTPYFQRVNNGGGDTSITISGTGLSDLNSIAGRQMRDELRRNCDAILENYEEDVTELIRGGLDEPETIGKRLCIDTASQCTEQQISKIPKEARLAGLKLPGMEEPEIELPPAPKLKKTNKKSKKKKVGKDEV